MDKKIDTNEKTSKNETGNIDWYQHNYCIYTNTKGDIANNFDLDKNICETTLTGQNFHKIGGDLLDLAFCNGEFVLCKNKESLEPQKFVSLKSLSVGIDICQKIPYRFSHIINKKNIYELVQHESIAKKIFDLFKPNENYYIEVKGKIYVFFGIQTELNLKNTFIRKNYENFLQKMYLNVAVSKNNHDIDFGWYPLGYPYHIGFLNRNLVIFKEKIETEQICLTVGNSEPIKGIPKSLDQTNSWTSITMVPRNELITSVETAKRKLKADH